MGKGCGLRWTEEQYQDYLSGNKSGPEIAAAPKPNKFHAVLTECDGIKFSSKKEAKYYLELKSRVHLGEVLYFLRQVPFDLPGGIKYRIDFMEVLKDGSIHYIDVKGVRTPMYKLKRKQVESLYPVRIKEA
jgi:hypothetical protein